MGIHRSILCLLGLMGLLGAGIAQGQVPSRPRPEQSPPVSPYINLARRGTPAGVNYYGIVRPQIAFRNSLGTLQQEVDTIREQETQTPAEAAAPATGHRAQFMNLSPYFPPAPGAARPRAETIPRTTTTIAPRGRSR